MSIDLGRTVQVIPHITNAIQDWIERVARIPVDDSGEAPDICISTSLSCYHLPAGLIRTDL